MQKFLIFSVSYFIFAVVFAALAGSDYSEVIRPVFGFLGLLLTPPYALAFVAGGALVRRYLWQHRAIWRDAFLATVSLLFLMTAFTTLKTAMPSVMPYWADPLLIEVDRALHFGTDPWRLFHAAVPGFDARVADIIYLWVWVGVVVAFPILLATTERDRDRLNCYLVLYAVAWAGLGNVVAQPLLSSGPIYVGPLYGDTSFDALHAALEAAGIPETRFGTIQQLLLAHLTEGTLTFGAGISAFPSVHVAVSTVVTLYIHDRFRHPVTSALGFGFLGVILFLSVWLGGHYAVDGYTSIAVLVVARQFIRRRITAARAEPEQIAEPVPVIAR
jgi:hypothetical protein